MSERGIELGIASQYIDAGDIVVAQFTVEGTNDGAIGFTEASRTQNIFGILRNLSLRQGRADRFGRSGGCYYDQYTVEKRLDELEVTQRAQERAFLQASPSDGKQQGGN